MWESTGPPGPRGLRVWSGRSEVVGDPRFGGEQGFAVTSKKETLHCKFFNPSYCLNSFYRFYIIGELTTSSFVFIYWVFSRHKALLTVQQLLERTLGLFISAGFIRS